MQTAAEKKIADESKNIELRVFDILTIIHVGLSAKVMLFMIIYGVCACIFLLCAAKYPLMRSHSFYFDKLIKKKDGLL